jgi:hypothetical protein
MGLFLCSKAAGLVFSVFYLSPASLELTDPPASPERLAMAGRVH